MIYKKDIYVVKEHDAEGSVNSVKNGGFIATDTYSVYPNGFFRCSNDGRYTKHIYIGAERIASQVGGKPYPSPNTESVSVAGRSNGIDIRVDYTGKLDQHLAQIDSVYDAFDLPYNGTNHDRYYNNYFFDRPGYWDNTEGMTLNGGEPEMSRSIQDRDLLYYYHRDHLGSSTAVSNDDGKLSQQIEYLPYGEVSLEKQMASSDYHSPHRFNGKELDEETGLYYYGARYYNPRLSIWYATDPMQEKYPNISSYVYCLGNPIKLVDPNGWYVVGDDGKAISYSKKKGYSSNTTSDAILISGYMMRTKTGREVFKKMLKSKYPIKLLLDKVSTGSDGNQKKAAGETYTNVTKDKKGNPKDFESVLIVIYKKVIEQNFQEEEMYKDSELSVSDIIGTVSVHEGVHATDKKANTSFLDETDPEYERKSAQYEEKALDVEQKAVNELKQSKIEKEREKINNN